MAGKPSQPDERIRDLWTNRDYNIFMITNLLPAFLIWLYPINWWIKLNWYDTGIWISMLVAIPAVLILLFIIPWAIAGTICLLKPLDRRRGMLMLFSCAAWALSLVAAQSIVQEARFSRLMQLGLDTKPLIAAIRHYKADNGAPPKSLNEIVPEYLESIPGTGIPVYPEFEYQNSSSTPPNKWVLWVNCTQGFMGFDRFIYLPEGNYPIEGYGGLVKPLGEWAYVFE